MKALKKLALALRAPALGLAISLLLTSVLLLVLGESPMVLAKALGTTLFTDFGLGYTLYYATPLIFTGLSVAVAFHCGLFNIGAEGQLYLGTIAVVALASVFPNLPWPIAFPMGIAISALVGGVWGGAVGVLKAKRGSHEVIVTILMNFIAIFLVDYAILYLFKDPDIQGPETITVNAGYHLPLLNDMAHWVGLDLFHSTPVNFALLIAIACAGLCYLFLFFTTYGYELRSVGQSPTAARFAGISVSKNTIVAFFLSGGLAGLVGVNEVMGYQHKVVEGFSPGYGFTGIAVALLARNHPLGLIFSALLFGALQNSARELEFESEKVTKELSLVLQGMLIAFVASHYLLEKWLKRKPKESKGA